MKGKTFLALLLSGALALSMVCPALAAEGEAQAVSEPAPWVLEYIADSYALGLLDDSLLPGLADPVTQEQLDAMAAVAGAKLALLELPQRTHEDEPLVLDLTRGGVMNTLYQLCADYDIEGVEEGVVPFLQGLGVVRGVNEPGNLLREAPCSYQEAMIMTQRLVLALYDRADAGSLGLLWKAVKGGNILYLLGTVHVDRSNVYPLHKSLREAIAASDEVIFEVELNDPQGMAEYIAMQSYTDGTTLADHVSPELYADTVQLFAALGLTEEMTSSYKPWALANTLTALLTQDDTTTGAAVAIDLYLTILASYQGKTIGAVESYAFQGGIFDTLSPEYQEAYLEAYVEMTLAALSGEGTGTEEDAEEALELQNQMLDALMEAWKARNVETAAALVNKAAVVASGDELNVRLFTDRDPNMIEYAARLLEREGENTFFLAVGAGHMLDPGGIVSGLRELGYDVEIARN